MERYDMHIHIHMEDPWSPSVPADMPGRLLAQLNEAGFAGACLFSDYPRDRDGRFIPFETRMSVLEAFTRGHEGRLFPIFWAHPDEPDAEAHILEAHRRGVAGYKFICDDYYVCEEKCMRLLRLIASLGKPVLFHSGILWYGGETGKYNRPLNWEALIDIPGLRFSMGHCSWPWHDECIAMYGKFRNHTVRYRVENPCEMFFDLTPGTPPIYRRELLFKLFNVGYEVGDNLMFGTDSVAPRYRAGRVNDIVGQDDALYREMGVPQDVVRKIYRDNMLRFLGVGGA